MKPGYCVEYGGSMVNSRNKGAAGEREWANWLKERGYEARRGQQFSGGKDSPDVVSNLPFHFEVKRVQALNMDKAMEQAQRDSEGNGKVPMVVHRKDRKEWKVTLSAEHFFELFEKVIRDEI